MKNMFDKTEQRYRWKLQPCPVYDVEKFEGWLEDMAREGWMLTEGGLHLGILAHFERCEPAEIRYRLEVTPRKSFYAADEMAEWMAENGWMKIASQGEFDLFRCSDPDAGEPHTDLRIQGITYKRASSHDILWILCGIYVLVSIITSASSRLQSGHFFTDLAENDGLWIFIEPFLLAFLVFSGLHHVISLRRIRRQLEAGVAFTHRREWKQGCRKYKIGSVVGWTLVIAFLIAVLSGEGCTVSTSEERMSFEKRTPFATMQDYIPGGIYKEHTDEPDGLNLTVSEERGMMTPLRYEWDEGAIVRQSDGEEAVLAGTQSARYYRCLNRWMADGLMREQAADRSGAKAVDLSAYGIDEAYLFPESDPYSMILRKGNTILLNDLTPDKSNTLSAEKWLEISAQMLR